MTLQQRQTQWDEYRVSLFKKKIREALPAMPGIRFERSKGRCHLIIDIRWRYYSNADEVGAYVVERLKASSIEASEEMDALGMSKIFGGEPKLDYIRIPIDQAALPERKLRFKREKG